MPITLAQGRDGGGRLRSGDRGDRLTGPSAEPERSAGPRTLGLTSPAPPHTRSPGSAACPGVPGYGNGAGGGPAAALPLGVPGEPRCPPAELPGTARHGTAQRGPARHGTAQLGTARHGIARHGTAWHCITRHGTALHSTARHCVARHGSALLGTARHGAEMGSGWAGGKFFVRGQMGGRKLLVHRRYEGWGAQGVPCGGWGASPRGMPAEGTRGRVLVQKGRPEGR